MSSTSDRLRPMFCLLLSLEFRSPTQQQHCVTACAEPSLPAR